MGEACSTHEGGHEKYIYSVYKNVKGRDNFGDLSVDGGNIKIDLKERARVCELDSAE
jgi:hypothetical protein